MRYGAAKVAELDFELELASKVKGVRLEFRSGKVVCATARSAPLTSSCRRTSTCRWTGALPGAGQDLFA